MRVPPPRSIFKQIKSLEKQGVSVIIKLCKSSQGGLHVNNI